MGLCSFITVLLLLPFNCQAKWWKKHYQPETKFLGIKGIFVPIPIPVKVGKVQFMKW